MKTLRSLFFVCTLLLSPALNAESKLTGNEETDTVLVHNTMRTLDARARHCHRMMNYLGGYNAAAELYQVLQGDTTGNQMLLGACVEFVKLSTTVADLLTKMEELYKRKPDPPGVSERANVLALILYLQSIEKEAAFMGTFTE